MSYVKRTERGWPGHYVCAHQCLFRRNTLLEYNDIKIVVSSVGNYIMPSKPNEISKIGPSHYFETMAFHADYDDHRYYDADVSNSVSFDSPGSIGIQDADDLANDMHETVVDEISNRLLKGDQFND